MDLCNCNPGPTELVNVTTYKILAFAEIDFQTNPLARLDGTPAAAGAAGPNIAGWIQTLHGNAHRAGISAEWQTLHDALTSGATDTGALAKSLGTLCEHTTKVAASATPDAHDQLRQLGHALTAAAAQLHG